MIACHMTDFKFLDTNIEHHFVKNKKEFHGLAANAHTCIYVKKNISMTCLRIIVRVENMK